MQHKNSVFHDLVKSLPWGKFDALVAQHEADKHVRRLSTKSQLIALLYGQFSGASSLREIVDGLESHSARLYHIGARAVQRLTVDDRQQAGRRVRFYAEDSKSGGSNREGWKRRAKSV